MPMESLLTLQINNYYVAIVFWNIFLALIPCFIVYRLSKGYYLKKWANISQISRLWFLLIFLVWFFFFPNTAYLFADIRHLADYCEFPGPFKACAYQAYIVPIFFTYTLVGVPTFYYALSKMSYILGKLFGQKLGKQFPIYMIPITAIGLMLGLVNRFNSWDIVLKPLSIIWAVGLQLRNPIMLLNIASYAIMMYIIYYFIKWVTK